MKYTKKPVVIEAFQYDGDLMNSKGEFYVPQWAIDAYENSRMYHKGNDGKLYIETLEGEMSADVSDYIIKGVENELYPCKPGIFEKTYTPVDKQIKTIEGPVTIYEE